MGKVLEGLIKKMIESFLTEAMILKIKGWLMDELKALAARTDNEIDDAIVAIIDKALS